MKLYLSKDDLQGVKARLVASFAKLGVETVEVDHAKQSSFRKTTPAFRLPALETVVATYICGSNAICRHIARLLPGTFLYGESAFDSSEVDMWLDYATKELEGPSMEWLSQGNGSKVMQGLKDALEVIDEHLKLKTYLVGERMTIADICVSAAVSFIGTKLDKGLVSSFGNVTRWKETICNRKEWKEVVPTCCAASTPSAAAPASSASAPGLDMNEWKRVYSNTKDLRGVAMPWLWKNGGCGGYSFYYMKYQKLEGECTVAFLTSNQLGGFLQRLDNSIRKDAFGVINVVGEEGNYDIQGVWMFAASDIPPQMRDHPSFEYNTWKKLDPKNATDKKLIEDYFCEENSVEGKRISDCKVYK